MDRKQLLSEWKRYPSAPKGCQSLLRWQKTRGWVGARVGFVHGRFVLHSEPGLSLVVKASRTDAFLPGDHVAAELTEANADGSWNAKQICLLAPAEELPKLEWNPNWRPFLQKVRSFFIQKKFTEIETPSLTICPGLEPTLEPMAVGKKFLPTSPEIHLKKALCLGFSDIFEIKNCFRDNEISEHHQPEFHMLEWYRAYADLELIIQDLSELVQMVGGAKPEVTTFQNLFKKYLQIDLKPDTPRETYWQWCLKEKLHPNETDTKTDLFHRLWIDRVEKNLNEPTIVRDFPPEQAALARISPSGWADRFELFWQGLEIANAFHEVNDPNEQAQRWQIEKNERKRLERTTLPHDEELLTKMKMHGLPPTGGIALGLERLFMAAHGVKDIRSLRLF